MAGHNGVPARTPPQTIFILAYDDCDQLDVTGPYEILRTAVQQFGVALDVRIVSIPSTVGPGGLVRSSSGLDFVSQTWCEGDLPDILIVAGGIFDKQDASGKDVPAGIGLQRTNPAFTSRIREQHSAGKVVASVCTGAFGVVGAGIAGDRHVTTHPGTLDMLADFAKTIDPAHPPHILDPDWVARVVDAGDLITCGGVTSGIDEALYLLQAFWPGNPSLVAQVRGFVDFLYRSPVATFPR
jgi:transcriptional regulator GlxA family with amidase domain